MSSRVEQFSYTGSRLQGSYRPIVIWMRFIGIPLEIPNKLFRYFIIFYGILLLFITILGNIGTIYIITAAVGMHDPRESTTFVLSNLINKMNQLVSAFLVQLGLLTATSPNWQALFKMLNILEKQNFLRVMDYRKFRTLFFLGSTVILIVMK